MGQVALAAGPMLGELGYTMIQLWVRTSASARVEAIARPIDATAGAPRSAALVTAAAEDFIATLALEDLRPGTRYAYEILLDGVPVADGVFQTRTHWLVPGAMLPPPDVRLAFGSCAYVNDPATDRPTDPYGGDYQIFAAIAAQAPDLMLWLGDNTYYRPPDLDSEHSMRRRYAHTRSLPELQPLLAATAHYAIWDDHDYGPDDTGRTFSLREAAARVFRDYWPSAGEGLREAPGLYRLLSWSDIELFLLDDRSHRSPNRAPDGPAKAMLGPVQVQWLLDALTASRATFKLVCCGNQMIAPRSRFESWGLFEAERQAFLAELLARRVEGVLFLSGDIHAAELLRVERDGAYPLYEFSSSPLTSGMARDPQPDNPARVEGTWVIDRRNFGLATVSGAPGSRTLRLSCHDAQGAEIWRHEIAQAELRMPP